MMGKTYSEAVERANNRLHAELNYGGIHFDRAEALRPIAKRPIQHDWQSGDLPDEIGKMRDIAKAYLDLANALESDNSQ